MDKETGRSVIYYFTDYFVLLQAQLVNALINQSR
jgi:hypothetical protein